MTPQEAIIKGLPKPSECDIVLVLLWSRMGTPFDMDSQHFESGTHWELLDAIEGGREALIYRRTTDPDIKRTDPKHAEKDAQWERLSTFLKSELFYDPDGITIRRGINFYENPDDFRQMLEQALRECVKDILDSFADHTPPPTRLAPTDSSHIIVIEPRTWAGSPFPGLRAFEEKDTPIFFGRDLEIHLPLEWEWQWAAQNGTEAREYPWGLWDKHRRANTTEAGINNRSTAVGMYPHGVAACGALDMAGNLWEWCLNEYQSLLENINDLNNRAMRGGSFYHYQNRSACLSRKGYLPYYGWSRNGGRVVCASILNL